MEPPIKQKKMVKWFMLFLTVAVCLVTVQLAHSRPYHGDVFTFYQPDGQKFQVRLFGDEYFVTIETVDGYTLTKDIATGFYTYARLAPDGMSLISSGIKAGENLPPGIKIEKHYRLAEAAVRLVSDAAREKFGVDSKGRLVPAQRLRFHPQDFGYDRWTPELEQMALEIESSPLATQLGPPSSTTTGTRVGLVLLARFPDRPQDVTISQAQVDAYANDPSYTEFNNATSVYGYFDIQSDGKLQYNCIVTAYFTAAQNRDYYTDSTIAYGTRAKELINEGLAVLKADGFDFTKADGNSDSVLDGVNIFYAGTRVNSWSEGLWPHKWSSSWSGLAGEGVSTSFQYQITDIGSELSLGTFCHENGHMICKFPDLYSYSSGAANIGSYSLMHSSGSKHPVNVDAYLKIHAGWAHVIDVDLSSHLRGAVDVDQNTFYRYQNPVEPREYFLLSIRSDTGYEGIYGGAASSVNPTNGLVIWHAREHGSNTYSSIVSSDDPANYTTPYELMVVEANPSSSTTPWYNDPTPGTNDAYHSADVSEASDTTSPALKFWNTATGRTATSSMHIHTISAQGNSMTFILGSGAVTGSPVISMTSVGLMPSTEYGEDAPSDTFEIYNSGAGTLDYSITDNASWLSVSPASGTSTTEADQVTVTYNTDALAPGTYNATISITDGGATNSPQTIPVSLTVQPQPTITLTPLTFSKTLSAGALESDSFTIANSGGGTLYYSLSAPAPWLEITTNSGTVATEEDEIEITFDATGLVTGAYTTQIILSSSSATNSPQVLDISMTVTGGGSLAVASPNGGETLRQGNNHDIRWLTNGDVSGNVAIELYKGGVLDSTISANTDNNGLYTWNIPPALTTGSDYRVRITSINEPALSAESAANFSIEAMPVLVSIPYSESFESGIGDWQQVTGDDIDWTVDSGGTPSSNTGPGTAQDGSFYIYTEASSPNFPAKSAILEASFDLRTANAPLMTFYYHMYGATMGELQVRISSDLINWTTLLNQSGNLGDVWNNVNADLSPFAGQAVTIQILGLTGSSWASDMAIDAISISEATRTLSYSSDSFIESSNNDGSIANSITITLAGDTLTSTAVSGGHLTASNIPVGLSSHFTRDSSNQITFSLTGNAISHDLHNSIQFLHVQFDDAAFTSGSADTVARSTKDMNITFIETTAGAAFSIDDPTVTEGDAGTTTLQFTVSLSEQPGSTVTVNYATSNGSAITGSDYIAKSGLLTFGATETSKTIDVTVYGDYIDEADETIIVTLNNNSAGTSMADSTGTGTINDDDTAGVTVSTISGNTTEGGGTATFTVILNSEPTHEVTIGISSSDTSEGTVSLPSLTFLPGNWDSAQTVTVTGVNDDVDDGNVGYTIITGAATSSDPKYNGMNPNDVSLTNIDNDIAGITVSSISGNTTENGGTATFTVVLDTEPTHDVMIGISSSDTTEGTVSTSSLIFTAGNWNSTQTVTVTGVDDDIDDGDIAYTIVTGPATSTDTNYSGMNAGDAAVTNEDNDTAGIMVSSISGNTTEGGGQATFTVVLNSEPTANVTVGVSSSDTTEGTPSPASLTFTGSDWDTAQTITVTGEDDLIMDGNIDYTIITAPATSSDPVYNGMNAGNVSVTNMDNDTPGISVSTISNNTSESGGPATFTVILDSQPTANVTVGLSSSDLTEGTVSAPSLTFTDSNWETAQVVTVTGVDDYNDDGNISYTVITAPAASGDANYSGMDANDVAVINEDDDTAGIAVSSISNATTEDGGTATFTVVLESLPSATVHIDLSSDDTTEGTVLPVKVSFSPANWNNARTITVTGVPDNVKDGAITYHIVTAAATSSDPVYNGMDAADVTVINEDGYRFPWSMFLPAYTSNRE